MILHAVPQKIFEICTHTRAHSYIYIFIVANVYVCEPSPKFVVSDFPDRLVKIVCTSLSLENKEASAKSH